MRCSGSILEKLIPRVPNLYRQYSSADLLTKMISKVEALQNIYLRVFIHRLSLVSQQLLQQ